MKSGKKFVEPPKHPMSLRHQREVASKLNALLNGIIVDDTGNRIGVIHYADGNTVFEFRQGKGGSYQGEYDQTKSYAAGDTFKISTALTIGGDTISAGYYGVRPASAEVDSQTFGPWAGTLPANPATAGIDLDKLFFNPENTYPTLGAAPNDKLYAELINSYC